MRTPRLLALSAFALSAVALAACAPQDSHTPGAKGRTDTGATEGATVDELGGTPLPDGSALPEDPDALLLFMREEEKLARDVYAHLDAVWGSPQVFANISDSEQSHMDELLAHIERLGLTDPVVDDSRGAFQDAELADLYDELTALGETSVADALLVGALIEDLDIVDLQRASEGTEDAAVAESYALLACGSRNHMRAFAKQLGREGLHYTPQYLSTAELDAILASDSERCGAR